jgi:hypothetical protein
MLINTLMKNQVWENAVECLIKHVFSRLSKWQDKRDFSEAIVMDLRH